jgi:hypothetical protein
MVCLAACTSCTAWPAATASVAALAPSGGGDSLELSLTLLALVGSGAAVGDDTATSPPCGGAAFCYLFVSTTANAGATFGGVDVADSQCASDKPGALPGTGTDYKAILMSAGVGSVPARSLGTNWVLYPLMEYRRADGTTVIQTTNSQAEFPASLINSPNATFISIFTGIDRSGASWVVGQTCTDWTSGGGNYHTGAANGGATAFDTGTPDACGSGAVFYCAQQ